MIRLAGLPLGHIPDSATNPGNVTAQEAAPASHSVIVRRDGNRFEIYVDGLPVLLDPSEKLTERLSIEPAPDETAVLRILSLPGKRRQMADCHSGVPECLAVHFCHFGTDR